MKKTIQRIRYVRSADGIRLAWADAGSGPVLVKAANWMTHLEFELESPVWRHWIRFFTDHFRYIRHDERGCGMTDWEVGDLSFERWVEDLESVVQAAAPQKPFAMLGISQGAAACIGYADEASGRRSASSPLWRLRSRTVSPRRRRSGAHVSCDDRPYQARVGQ